MHIPERACSVCICEAYRRKVSSVWSVAANLISIVKNNCDKTIEEYKHAMAWFMHTKYIVLGSLHYQQTSICRQYSVSDITPFPNKRSIWHAYHIIYVRWNTTWKVVRNSYLKYVNQYEVVPLSKIALLVYQFDWNCNIKINACSKPAPSDGNWRYEMNGVWQVCWVPIYLVVYVTYTIQKWMNSLIENDKWHWWDWDLIQSH